ncbi:BrnT family toxin [Bdellovibrio sp. BCCA]|uniref:BrnT family toxin n=1 Tax=Bdellovibrio sp. BCCA TaxID=3136281 RepID=UPI0030F2218A
MRFIWDENKNIENQIKHGISFEEAISVFDSDFSMSYDAAHSTLDEDRYITKGMIDHHGIILVVHTEPEENVYRIISARKHG